MTRAITSTPDAPQPLARVVAALKGWVERCGEVWVEGQIIQINRRTGVTQFLVMRDSRASVSAKVTCTRLVLDNAGPITEGTTVAARVKPRVFEQSADLTLECLEMRPMGEGQLLARLEQLKRKLQAEGLFDPARKKQLPFVPRRIGLIAGASSDAERDVIENTRRRWPSVEFVVRSALVQGSNAAESVIDALRALHEVPEVDVVVIARGGGALEDLLPFSDEGLVRAVAASRIPVVSAIGHEKDSPILDNVADLRASTPTDAAKLVVPSAADEAAMVQTGRERIRQAIAGRLEQEQYQLDQLRSRPVLRNPLASYDLHTERLEMQRAQLRRAIHGLVDSESREVHHLLGRVRSMSPKGTLERGYAILTDGSETITSVHDLDEGDDLLAYVADGTIVLEVRETQPSDHAPANEQAHRRGVDHE